VRPAPKAGAAKQDDQSRTATPTEAIRAGADFVIVGRPILEAADPRQATQEIVDEIAAAQ
jgi:orotidine-5'-phosphate decarboxylase